MIKKLMLAATVATATTLAACGGGGGDSADNSSNTAKQATVAGPLDTVQTTLSSSIFAPLESATGNTPLAGVITCVNGAVIGNVLDIGDSVLNALGQPTTSIPTIASGLQVQVNQLAQNLLGLLNALASKGNCSQPSTASGTNPLAGTPLAPLYDQLLPAIQQALSETGSGNSNGFASLAALVTQLDTVLKNGLAQIPASAKTAPIVGGSLTTVESSLSDTAGLLTALANNSSGGINTSVQNLLDHLLVNVLTGIVPVTMIETQAGKPGAVSGPVDTAASTFASTVASALSTGTPALLSALSNPQLAPVLNPVVNGVLPALINPLTKLLDGTGSATTTPTGGPTGTALDAALTPITQLLGTVLGSAGTGTTCVFTSLPIVSSLCPK